MTLLDAAVRTKPGGAPNRAPLSLSPRAGLLQRKCACGGTPGPDGECAACKARRLGLQRRALGAGAPAMSPSAAVAPPIVHEVLRSPGQPLDAATRAYMEPRFGHDFGKVRVHSDARAAESARAIDASAYAVGQHIVFGSSQYAPSATQGKHLIAHELAHTVQQEFSAADPAGVRYGGDTLAAERHADAAADAVLANHPMGSVGRTGIGLYRRAAPYLKKIAVHLAPPQTADLTWEGSPPADATGSDHFTVSTGKGYSDIGDPAGTCTRTCCNDPDTQCAPPWNQPGKVGACCTYYGSTFWTGTPLEEHNGWQWWTPIQPYYSSRGIALHQHDTVTGQPIGHGCVRMDEPNAKRIYDFSNGRQTNVTIDGRAAPVACDDDRRCSATSSPDGPRGELEGSTPDEGLASSVQEAVAGLEGVMS